jgi:hypothetical protein
MSNYVTRQALIPARIETLQCNAWTLPPTNRNFIWPEYKASFEAMTPNSSRDKNSWKSFEHYKRSISTPVLVSTTGAVGNHLDVFQGNPVQHYYDWASSSDPFAWFCNEYGAAGEPFNDLPKWYEPTGDGFAPTPDGLDGLKQRSLRSMLPYIKSELSLINSILELKDFKSLPKTITNAASVAKSLLSKITWRGSNSTLRRLLHATADSYLQMQFNILPLLSDISGIHAALTSCKAKLNALVAGQGYTQKKHYKVQLTVPAVSPETKTFTSPLSPFGPYPPYQYGCAKPCGVVSKATRYVYTDVSTFHAEIEYNYNYTQYQVEHAQLLGLLDALGVNLNPAIIWNAIPWSFVIDWVLDVSRWLNDRRILNMEPQINIHNYLWSYTGRRRILIYREVSRDLIYHDIGSAERVVSPGVPLPVTTESVYKRVVEMPSAGSITSSGLSLKEFSLGAALVTVRGSHHKRSRQR